ncbi:hypothetical protein Lal_00027861 [Lupinus albus]|nr:hypothetical protein Lal_00027861 [Lupinus albus]
MISLTRVLTSFILSNTYQVSRTSDLPMTKAYLAYCLRDKRDVDVAAILSDEFFRFMINEPSKTRGNLGLITGLPEIVWVEISTPLLNQLKAPINLTYIQKCCVGKKVEAPGHTQAEPPS